MSESDAKQGSSQIVKNVLLNWVAFAATLLIGFFMSPFLVRHLGEAVYGVWVLTGSLVGYLGLLDFGVSQSTVKYVAEHRARRDQEAINRVVTCGLAVYTTVGLISLGVCLILAVFFNRLFHTPLSAATASAVMVLAGLNLAISFPASIFVGVLRGCQRYDIDAGITTLVIVVRSVATVALILRGYGILSLALVTFSFDMVRLLYLMYRVVQLNPQLRIARAYLKWQEMRRLFNHSIHLFLIQAGGQINFTTDSIIIGLFLTTREVTVYFIASRLVIYLRSLVVEMVGVLMPAVSGLHARGDHAGVQELLVTGTRYTLLLALPVGAVFFVLGDIFIALWMGAQYQTSALLLSVLTAGILAHLLEMTATTVLTGSGQHGIVARFTILQALTNLALSLLLVKPLGLLGVALGTTISMIVFTVVSLPIYFRYHLRLPIVTYLRQAVLPPLLVQAPFIIVLLLWRAALPPVSLGLFFIAIAVALLPYGALVFFTCMRQSERRAFLQLAGKLRLKPAL